MKPETRWRRMCWIVPVIASVLIFLALLMVLLFNTKDHTPSTKKTFICDVKNRDAITFQSSIVITCSLNTIFINQTLHIRFVMIDSLAEPETEIFKLSDNCTLSSRLWNILFSARGNKVTLTRNAVTCAGAGKYQADINIGVERDRIDVDIKDTLTETSILLSRDLEDFGGNLSYGVTCSLRSGCYPALVTLLGSQGNTVIPVHDVNLTCISLYSGEEGWSTECYGVVMESTLRSMSGLMCRPYPSISSDGPSVPTKSLFLSEPPPECKSSATGRMFPDSWSCGVYHLCATESVLMTQPCNKDKYFDLQTCTCRNTDQVSECDQYGKRVYQTGVSSCIPNK
ncbi:uncharacterized protein LOC132558105 [Ylistrum balloti]|uniref:uncharacterized protein LOC132558105 n=1 Tax=Ylistrum balloti TaxID=509963 RepID=UPI002905CC5F|nr:uncharacterized protein LOC132558105 [Ylistrum balloti]